MHFAWGIFTVWDYSTGTKVKSFTIPGHYPTIFTAVPDGRLIVKISLDSSPHSCFRKLVVFDVDREELEHELPHSELYFW
jgi:hypothetical protein